jgi:general secretion pathway protein A
MYQSHFGLHDDPFALGPNLRFLFRSRAHAETMAHLGYGLDQGEDIVLISGAIGTGKTLALQNLQAKVSKLFRQVLINVTQVDFAEFLKLVLHELDETWPDHADVADLLVRLKDRAASIRRSGHKVLLVVDEAQNLDAETLEGIRLLTNLGQPESQIFQIVLSGQPSLDDLINRPELAQLRQRIRIHYQLEPLSAKETGEYINHRLAVAGREKPLFTASAVAKIHALSEGTPRLVNHLAGQALLAAFVERARKVDAKHVDADDMPAAPRPQSAHAQAPAPTAPAISERAAAEPVAQAAKPPHPPSRGAAPRPTPAPERAPRAEPPPPPTRDDVISRPAARAMVEDEYEDVESEPRRRLPAWAWVAVIMVVIAAAGSWVVLRDDSPLADVQPPPPVVGQDDGAPAPNPVEPAAEQVTVDESPTTVAAATPGHWLHVASFRSAERAQRYRSLLAGSGAPVTTREVVLGDGQPWQRVLVGPYPDETAAEAAADDLAAQGLITFHRPLAE